jgi:hypothetical protein
MSEDPERPVPPCTDDEGGEPPCYAHLLDDDPPATPEGAPDP